MKTMKARQLRQFAVIPLFAALLAACNSEDAPGPKAAISNVIVAGDSLADVGTFGYKATIQNSADPVAGFPIYPEIVAQNFGISGQCNFYSYNSTDSSFATNAGCSNFAVGGGRIVNPVAQGGATVPINIPTQLTQAAAAAGGSWKTSDLLLVDGGGNDLADLTTAYLGAAQGNITGYRTLLLQQLAVSVVDPLLAQGAPGFAEAGRYYMQALANTFYASIKRQGLDRGATHVVVLNIPEITLTPRFGMVLGAVSASAGQAQADAVKDTIQEWGSAFNAQLKSQVGGDSRVAVVDFYSDLIDQVSNKGQYGVVNADTASCPITGVDGMGLPTYSFPVCTSDTLDAAPPAGLATGWWKNWTFADGFHPTPYGHRLLASTISRAMSRAGWL